MNGLMPAALVLANPHFLRPCFGLQPLGGVHLHTYAVDIARSPDGRWWVLADRTQAPSGMGYTLQNRLITRAHASWSLQSVPRSAAGAILRHETRNASFARGDAAFESDGRGSHARARITKPTSSSRSSRDSGASLWSKARTLPCWTGEFT